MPKFKVFKAITIFGFLCLIVCSVSGNSFRAQASSTVAVDSVSPTAGNSVKNANLTYSFTNTAGTLLIVCATAGDPSQSISGITYGSAAMSLVAGVRSHDGTTGAYSSLWYLLNPATGANSVVVTKSGSAAGGEIISGAVSFTGNDSANPIAQSVSNHGASGTSATVAASGTTAGNMLVDCATNGSPIGSSSQTLNFKTNTDSSEYGNNAASSYAATTGGSVTMGYTGNSNDGWGIVAAEIKANSVADTQPPTIPTNLSATAVSSSAINLSWTASTDNVGVTAYTIYRGGTQVGTSATNSYSDTGLTASTQYTYTVDAVDGAGNHSSQSASSQATTQSAPPPDTTPPTVPTNLTATAISSSQINLTWTSSTDNVGVTGYKIFRGSTQVGTSAVNNYSDTGLTASIQYTYTVSAYDAAGNNSSQSFSSGATTQAASSYYQLTSDRIIPWQDGSDLWNNGVLPTYSQVDCSGLAGNGTTNDGPAIQTCINNAAANTAVYIPAGTYYVNSTVRLKSGMALRGAGSGTILDLGASGQLTTQNFSHSTNINPPTTYNQIPSTFTLSGTPQKGDTTVTCATGCSNVSVGTWIKIFGNDDPALISDPGGSCDYCSDDTGAYLLQQIVQVTAINGAVFTLSRPLYHTPYTVAVKLTDPAGTEPAGAKFNIISFQTQKAGYEYFHVVGTGDLGGNPIIDIQGCLDCWVRGIESQYSGSSSDGGHIRLQFTYGNEIRDNYVHEERSGASGSGYGIWSEWVNGDTKIENNIVRHTRHGIIWEGGGSGEAVLYNYLDDNFTDDMTYLGSARPNHGAHPYMQLWEGNIASHVAEDDLHGSASNLVFFRNNFWGDETDDNGGCSTNIASIKVAESTPVSGNYPLCTTIPGFSTYQSQMLGFAAIDVFDGNNYLSFVDNVLGRTGMHANWSNATLRADSGSCCTGTTANPYVYAIATTVMGSTPVPNSTILLHGNWDFKTNGVAYWDGGSNHALADSWYYSSEPGFLVNADVPWPAIGGDVTGGNLSGTSGRVNTNAAYDCYWNVLHANGVFDASTCYTSSGGGGGDTAPPSTPTGLTATAISGSQINLLWIASTDNVAVTGYKVYRGGVQIGTSATNSYSDTGLTVGTNYTYTVSAYDAAGNNSAQSTSASATTQSAPDTTPPTATITSPQAGTVSGTITFSATASDPTVTGQVTSGLKLVTLSVDGSVFATSTTGSISKSLDTTTLANASHSLTASAVDNAGNNSTISTISITVNNASATKYPRTVSLTGLEGIATIPSNTTITAIILSPGSGATLETQSNLSATAGKYTITFLSSDPQLVNIRIKVNGYLSQLLTSIDTTVNSGTALSVPQLLAGDSNNDNVVNSLDYSLMNTNWLKNSPASDFNLDGIVNSLDFAILKNNFNKGGQ
ncbi:MAG: fibronectin type III domain-containing protein [Candidatus Doudnabacteria bacterium]|nr:fibronectin type III domain-containing protein [Candidatus Doudnabacteria bacterium]